MKIFKVDSIRKMPPCLARLQSLCHVVRTFHTSVWRNEILKSVKMCDCRRMSELSREQAELLQTKAQVSGTQRNSRRLYCT
jgi:hypothetical protein